MTKAADNLHPATDPLTADQHFVLSAPGPAAVQLSTGTRNGQPTARIRKQIARTGTFAKGSQKITLSHSMLDHWAKTFAATQQAGVLTAIKTDDHDGEAGGLVEKMFRDGDGLFVEGELIGANAIAASKKNDCSLYSPPEYVDAQGQHFVRPIRHVAMTSHPVVDGLGKFETISLSYEAPTMDKIIAALALSADSTEDQIVAAVEALKGEVKLSKASPATPDPLLVSTLAENANLKLSQLVPARISPATRDRLAELFVGKDNAALALSLSNKTQDTFAKVLAILSENVVTTLGSTTPPQVLALSDPNKPVDGAGGVAAKVDALNSKNAK